MPWKKKEKFRGGNKQEAAGHRSAASKRSAVSKRAGGWLPAGCALLLLSCTFTVVKEISKP